MLTVIFSSYSSAHSQTSWLIQRVNLLLFKSLESPVIQFLFFPSIMAILTELKYISDTKYLIYI